MRIKCVHLVNGHKDILVLNMKLNSKELKLKSVLDQFGKQICVTLILLCRKIIPNILQSVKNYPKFREWAGQGRTLKLEKRGQVFLHNSMALCMPIVNNSPKHISILIWDTSSQKNTDLYNR